MHSQAAADLQAAFSGSIAAGSGKIVGARWRECQVLISVEEYQRLKRRDRQVLGLDDFTEADVAALEAAHAPDAAKDFDHELS